MVVFSEPGEVDGHITSSMGTSHMAHSLGMAFSPGVLAADSSKVLQ